MRVDIIELLRCPAAHAPTALVTVANARQGDRLIDGTLGCVVCGAEYELRDGVVSLGEAVPVSDVAMSDVAVDAMRTAALLGLIEPGKRVVLCGTYAVAALALVKHAGAVCLTVNASSADRERAEADHLVIGTVPRLSLADAVLDAMAVDEAHRSLLADAARVVRRGGRVLAPSVAPVPPGCTELARDEREWVAEVTATVSMPIVLRSARATS
jgi:uncharacterized protein YbaR (Trm112 family)